MASDFRVVETHSGRIARLYKDMNKVGRGGLRRELRTALARESKPARMRVRDNERKYLPSGMVRTYAKVPVQSFSVSGSGVTLRWRQRRGNSNLKALDSGRLRHPLFGDRNHWYTQGIVPGLWTDSVKEEGPAVADKTATVLKRYVERTLRG